MKKSYKQKIFELEQQIQILKNEELENRTFKIGDFVCYNHGEYPDYFSQDIFQITHYDYSYSKKGFPAGHRSGASWDDKFLRFAHSDEIKYFKKNLPFIFNNSKQKYEIVEVFEKDFKIGSLLDTRNLKNLNGKQLLTVLFETNMLSNSGKEYLTKIFNNLQ
jgi:hypothetical protein